MRDDMFLKIDDIKGESLDNRYQGAIDICAWTWGLAQPISSFLNTRTCGKVSVGNIQVGKFIDRSSPRLITMCCQGTRFKEALLVIRSAGGSKPVESLKIRLKNGLISSYDIMAGKGNERLRETLSFNFAEIEVEYTPQKQDGSAAPSILSMWNIPKNAEV